MTNTPTIGKDGIIKIPKITPDPTGECPHCGADISPKDIGLECWDCGKLPYKGTKQEGTMDFTSKEDRVIRDMVYREGARAFARTLVDELRNLASCKANSDTCVNETCHVAHAIEQGLDTHDFSKLKTKGTKQEQA